MSSTSIAAQNLQELVTLVDGVAVRSDETIAPVICGRHEAPLVAHDVLSQEGLYRQQHCPFAQRQECDHQGDTLILA